MVFFSQVLELLHNFTKIFGSFFRKWYRICHHWSWISGKKRDLKSIVIPSHIKLNTIMEALVQHWLDLFILGPRCFLLIWREREVLYGKILQTHGLYTTGPLIGKIESLNHPPAIPLDLPGLRWVAALQRQQSMRHSHTFGHWDPSEPHNGRLANPWDSWSQEECKPPKRETADQVRFKQLNHHRMPHYWTEDFYWFGHN